MLKNKAGSFLIHTFANYKTVFLLIKQTISGDEMVQFKIWEDWCSHVLHHIDSCEHFIRPTRH